MPDPFEALRTAPTPIEPDPAFAARLRTRLIRAFLSQGDQTMTVLHTSETTERLRQGDISYLALWVPDADRAARFFSSVLGWRFSAEQGPRLVEGQSIPQGLAQLQDAVGFQRRLGLSVELPRPTAYPVFVVDEIEAAVERVRAAGGQASPPIDQPYGRVAGCVDDQGLVFSLNEPPAGMPSVRPPASPTLQGDVVYLVFQTSDSARARAFYQAVLGLRFSPGRAQDGWNIADIVPMSGLSGGHASSAVVPMYRVDDIQAAVRRVRELGGTATDPIVEPYGTRAECEDDQGTRFYLGGA